MASEEHLLEEGREAEARTCCCPLEGHSSICRRPSVLRQSSAGAELCRSLDWVLLQLCFQEPEGRWQTEARPRAAPRGSTHAPGTLPGPVSLILFNPHPGPGRGLVSACSPTFSPSFLSLPLFRWREDVLTEFTVFSLFLNLDLHVPHCSN